jgi:hypothetical protein
MPLVWLFKMVDPVLKSADRDGPKDRFCRVLSALRRVTSGRSTFLADALTDPQADASEVADMVAETWVSMVESGFPFKLDGPVSAIIMELDRASRLTFGSETEKNLAFQEMFGELVKTHGLVVKCLGGEASGAGLQISLYQQLVAVVLPEAP